MQRIAPLFDLQSHSSYSDGTLPPGAVVKAARKAGVRLLALTDHDTVDGVEEAAASAATQGVRLVPAVEISAIDPAEGDLHLLGYLVDHRDRQFRAELARFRSDRERRIGVMAEKLQTLGFALDKAELVDRANTGLPIGRPHLARAVVTHETNRSRLLAEDRSEASAFLEGYLVEGGAAFEPRLIPSVAEAIESVHAAGGVAVWAHPFWGGHDSSRVAAAVQRFHERGLDGVECFYPTHMEAQAALLTALCERFRLLKTGSSDFHGPEHGLFSRFRAFDTYGLEPALGPLEEP